MTNYILCFVAGLATTPIIAIVALYFVVWTDKEDRPILTRKRMHPDMVRYKSSSDLVGGAGNAG